MIKLGYLTDWSDWAPTDERFKKLTHVFYSFAIIKDANGTVSGEFKKGEELKLLKKHFPHLKISISIGGWGAGNFSETAMSEAGRKQFSKTAIEMMKDFNCDGIDVDWEYPCLSTANISSDKEDKCNFTKLLHQIRIDLNNLGAQENVHYLLTIAAGASMGYIKNVELDKITAFLDFINLMTYDLGCFSKITAHHTNLFSSRTTNQLGGADIIEGFINAGVNPEKLVYGIAFYGRGGKHVENIGDGLNNKINGEGFMYVPYTDIANIYHKDPQFKQYWDNDAKAPYLFNGDTFITYDNIKSIKEKLEYVTNKNLAGVFFWEYSLDKTGELLDSIDCYSK